MSVNMKPTFSLLTALLLAPFATAQAADSKPNILFILLDVAMGFMERSAAPRGLRAVVGRALSGDDRCRRRCFVK